MNKLEFLAMNNPIRRLLQRYYELPQMLNGFNMKENLEEVLEIGCGNGYGSKLLIDRLNICKYFGIDLDKRMIQKAKNKNLNGAVFAVGSVVELPYKSGSFDAVFDFGILHHISNWHEAVAEVARVLKYDGLLIMEDFTRNSFNDSFVGRLLKRMTRHPYESQFTFAGMIGILSKYGLEAEYTKRTYPLGVETIFARFRKVKMNHAIDENS